MKIAAQLCTLIAVIAVPVFAKETPPPPAPPLLVVREARYDGKLTDTEARFSVDLDIESTAKAETSLPLFTGEVAVPEAKLPVGLRLVRDTNQYRLVVAKPGRYKFKIDLVAKIKRIDPWNSVSFVGPEAVIASVVAQAAGVGVELQLLSGTPVEIAPKDPTRIRGFLGTDRSIALRWQSKAVEVARKAVLTCDTSVAVAINPTVIKYTTQLRYEILQGAAAKLTLTLPSAHALTRLQGEGIRDWQVKTDGERQLLTVEFLKPVEKTYALTLFSEQTIESAAASAALQPPQPQEIERETGAITLAAEDVLVEIESLAGVRQVNATAGALSAYQFFGRPFTLALKLRRIEPVINVAARVTARLEESRLVVAQALTLSVEKAGVYAIDLGPLGGLVVTDVRGEGVADWKAGDGRLTVTFASRVLGVRKLDVILEQANKKFPEQIVIAALRVTGAAKETAQIGAASAAGIRLKTADLAGAREIPITALPMRGDELLAYTADQPDWKLTLATERLTSRVVAETFNLITIGDGLVGASATIRYAIINQGVQEFRVHVPSHWKNVDFTGPNIRRKEELKDATGSTWTISLQDKAWGGYTLVITYDYQFNPRQATLPAGGVHALDVERETGSVAITTAASLQITEAKATGGVKESGVGVSPALAPKDGQTGTSAPLSMIHRVDEAELAENDRALITRPVLLAYQYEGQAYDLQVNVTRFEEAPVLAAVADRTQLTTVLTEQGQMLTQASFMVKNNDKQYQTVTLPVGADFWSCTVNGQPAKPERTGNKLLIPLPRGVNRDEAFPVDIVYAQKIGSLKSLLPRAVKLDAPQTDMQTTYAEWELFVPPTHRLSGFGGNMTVARGVVYGLTEAWRRCLEFYGELFDFGGVIFVGAILAVAALFALVLAAIRRGWRVASAVAAVVVAVLLLSALLLPTLRRARSASFSISDGSSRMLGDSMTAYRTENGEVPPQLVDLPHAMAGEEIPAAAAPPPAVPPPNRSGVGGDVLFNDGHAVASGPAAPPPTATETAGKPAEPGADRATLGLSFGAQAQGAMFVPGGGAVLPVVAGIRPIRIEIPRLGNRFVFTKVLNVRDEPLTVESSVMRVKVFKVARAAAQLAAVLAGVALLWTQLRRARPGSLALTVALSLILGGVASVLIAAGLLHVAMILAPPVAVLALAVWLSVRIWKKREDGREKMEEGGGAEDATTGGVGPVVVSLALLLACATHAWAADVAKTAAPLAVTNVAPSKVTIESAIYTGTVRERVAEIEAVLQVSATENGQTVRLLGEGVALEQFTATPADVKLIRDAKSVSAQLGKRGSATLKLKFLVKLVSDPTGLGKRQLSFAVLPALSSKVSVTLPEPDAVVEFPSAVAFQTATANQQTRVEGIIGAAELVDLSWTARVKRAAEIAATVFCQNASLVSMGGGVLNVRSTLEYQVTQGELRQMRVRLPSGQRLMRVEGETIRTWKVGAEGNDQVVTVELQKDAAPSYRLTVETERLLEIAPDKLVTVETPHAVDVKRETGLIALKPSEELGVTVETADELQKVDVEEFGRAATATAVPGITSAYRFLKPEYALRVRVQPVQPQVEAVVRNLIHVGSEQLSLDAVVAFTIKRAGVFRLRLALPDGYRVENVATAANLAQWLEKPAQQVGGPRVLELTLKERTLGACQFTVRLAQKLRELPKSVAIVGVQPLDAQKSSGFVAVTAEEGVQIKSEAFEGLMEMPAAQVPLLGSAAALPPTGVLAFKLIPTEVVAAKPSWTLSVATEQIEPWIRAETMQWLTLTDTLVSGRAQVRFEIQNAPVKEFRVRVPAVFRNVEVTGLNIRRRDHEGEVWRVELQNKVRGDYTLTVTWDQSWNLKDGAFNVAAVSVEGVERETGALAVLAKPPLQVAKKTASEDLQPLDVTELPEWAGRAEQTPTLAFRYLRPGYKLALTAQRFEEAEVLQALADDLHLTTVVADDGQMMTEMSLSVRNNARQYLTITLPEKAEVWSAFVAGQPVRPTKRDGKVLVPLERSTDNQAVTVQVTYIGAGKFPRGSATVALDSPALDVPLKNARWEMYLPPDYRYSSFAGTMAHEDAVAPVYQSFSLTEYGRVEEGNKRARQVQVLSSFTKAKSELAKGNIKEANGVYNYIAEQSRSGRDGSDDSAKDYKELQTDLRRAQGRNLNAGQNVFLLKNSESGGMINGSAGGQANQPAQQMGQAAVQFDAEVAERQVEQLQKAQEVAVAKVLPLHVTLPTHGVRQAFTQVLQTEIGKPMTVQFSALNTKSLGWPLRVATAAAGFGLLWLIVSFTVARRKA